MIARDIKLPVNTLTDHANVDLAVMALKAGAFDFLQKAVDERILLEAIETASEGSLLRSLNLPSKEERAERLKNLSDRERQFLDLMLEPLPTKAIAERISISEWTAYEHRNEIYKKLDTKELNKAFEH